MTTYFVWIESLSSPPAGGNRKITFAVEQLPSGPIVRLESIQITEEKTARRCELLRQQNGIQVSIDGEHTPEFIVDKALAKVAYRRLEVQRDAAIRNYYE
ncbi:MAG TPA: hypothetical protein VG714_07645 [Acidobacteriaceae bacterium]|nr:hypothetical protein [Acidobacteriaceae bacterium]